MRKMLLIFVLFMMAVSAAQVFAADERTPTARPMPSTTALTPENGVPPASDGAANISPGRERMLQIRAETQQSAAEMEKLAKMSPEARTAYIKGQQIKQAVAALKELRNATGEMGIGKQISAIANQLGKSMSAMQSAEKRIQSKSRLVKALFGKSSAKFINKTIAKNEKLIQKLTQLSMNCTQTCKDVISEQISVLQAEQERLSAVAQTEMPVQGRAADKIRQIRGEKAVQ